MALTVRELAYRRSQIRENAPEGAPGGPDDDWAGAEFLMHQLVEEAAYYHWLDRVRARLVGDAGTDWRAAEAEIRYGRRDDHRRGMPGDVDRRLRRQVIRDKAYLRWLGRGIWGDPLPDWLAAEEEVQGHA